MVQRTTRLNRIDVNDDYTTDSQGRFSPSGPHASARSLAGERIALLIEDLDHDHDDSAEAATATWFENEVRVQTVLDSVDGDETVTVQNDGRVRLGTDWANREIAVLGEFLDRETDAPEVAQFDVTKPTA